MPTTYWAASDIATLSSHGILTGLPDGTFQPDGTVTRAQFAKILVLVKGIGTPPGAAPTFTDVPKTSWSFPFVEAAYHAGIIQGTSRASFAPDAPVTRQDMAVMIGRSLSLQTVAQSGALQTKFTDLSLIAGYAAGFVAADAQLGLMQGVPGGAFAPLADTTRAQAAAVAARLMQLSPTAVSGVMALAAQSLHLLPEQSTVAAGSSVHIAAQVIGPGGAVLPLQPTFSATGGTIDAQGTFTATAPGVATISAHVGTVSASVQVTIINAATTISMTGLPATMTAGTDVTLQLSVLDGQGHLVSGDSGRTLLIQVTGPGNPSPLSANDTGGQAAIDWKPTVSGTYNLEASGGALQPTAQVTVTVAPDKPSQLVLTANPGTLTSTTQASQIQAAVEDAYGNVVPTSTAIQLALSPAGGGSLDATTSSIQGGPSLVANFHPTGSATAVQVQATAPQLGLLGSATLQITIEPSLAFVSGGAQSATAGTTLSVPVQELAPDGTPMPVPGGTALTLNVTAPDGSQSTVTTTTAAFTLSETVAGSYQLEATGDHLTTSAPETVTFTPGTPVGLRLWSAPTFLLAPGQKASLHAAEVDKYGNQTPNAFPVVLAVTGADSGLTDTVSQASAGGVVGTFVSYGPGTANLTVSSPGSGLPNFQYQLQVRKSSAGVVAGKGVWLRYSDVTSLGAEAIVKQAQAEGLTHLYVWVGSTYNSDGFMGADLLASILPLAHQAHISVIAWIYNTLADPAADLQLAQQVYSYTTPSGDRADGLALDLETDSTMTPAIVGPFDQGLRKIVGPSYPLIAVTYPPQFRPNYPFATLAQTFDAIAPMDYWHVQEQGYSGAQVQSFVQTSIDRLRAFANDASLPVSVIVQGYDLFNSGGQGTYSPTAAEMQGAVQGAAADGAIGVSLYEWTTATPAEWQAFLATAGPSGG